MKYFIPILLALFLVGCGGSSTKLETIQISASQTELPAGDSSVLKVQANYSNGTSKELNSADVQLVFAGDATYENVLFNVKTLTPGTLSVTAKYQNMEDSIEITVLSAELRKLILSDMNISLPLGEGYNFQVEGLYSDGSQQEVAASYTDYDTSIVSISESGQLATLSQGETSVNVTFDSLAEQATITVTDAEPVFMALSLVPAEVAAGESSTGEVTVTYTDGTNVNKSTEATFSSPDSIVEVDGATIKSLQPGTATIHAEFEGLNDSANLSITSAIATDLMLSADANSLPKGTNLQLIAEAYYSDGSVRSVASEVEWQVENSAIIEVGSNGLLKGLTEGSSTVYATYAGYSDTFEVAVTEAIITQVNVTPEDDMSTYEGGRFNATASGTYSDGSQRDITSLVHWETSNADIATVSNHSDNAGLVSTHTPGEAIITATLGGQSNGFNLTVEELVVVSIEVTTTGMQNESRSALPRAKLFKTGQWQYATTSDDTDLPEGRTRQLYAIGTFQNGDTADITGNVTWSINDTTIAQFETPQSKPGLLTARAAGVTDIAAVMGNVTGNYQLTVSSAVLEGLTLTHSWTQVFTQETVQATVEGHFSNNQSRDLTNEVSWQTSDNTVFQVSNQAGQKGVVTAVAAGSATLTAALNGVDILETVTITENVIESVSIEATRDNVYLARKISLTAHATMTNGQVREITSEGQWAVNNTAIASISTGGEVTALSTGNVVVTFTAANGVNTNFTLLVKPISEMAKDFSKSMSASVSIVNGHVQYGSQFSYSITNNTGENLELIEFHAQDESRQIAASTNPDHLNNGVISAGGRHGLTITIGVAGAKLPLTFTFVVRDPVSGESFNVSHTYN